MVLTIHIESVYDRFAQYLSQERKARSAAKSTPAKQQPTSQPTTPAKPPSPTKRAAPSAAPKEHPQYTSKKPPPIEKPPQPEPSLPSPATNLAEEKSARELVIETQVEHQERAYVTFPYFPSLTFFDSPFETTHSGHGSPHAAPQAFSYMEPVYSTYSYPQPESESSRRSRGQSSFSRSSQSRSSSYSDDEDSDHGSLVYYDNTHHSYPKMHSYNSQPSSSRYHDYFNIFNYN